MHVIVALLAWALVVLALLRMPGVDDAVGRRRFSVLLATVFCATWMAVTTELLSLFSAIGSGPLTLSWAILAALAAGRLVHTVRQPVRPISPPVAVPYQRCKPVIATLLGLVLVFTGITALLSPPNTWDSMTYHMPRVMHWVQSRSLEHYPTNIPRQLQMPPLAEVAIMHGYLLFGDDRLANMVQWSAMVGSLLAVSLIAGRLGLSAHGQLVAVAVCASIPSGVLQSSSTQNDYVLAFFLACTVVATLRIHGGGADRLNAVFAGASLGLAMLTKGTGYVYALPLVVVLMVRIFHRRHPVSDAKRDVDVSEAHQHGVKQPLDRMRRLNTGLALMVSITSIALLLNVGHYRRNVVAFGSPLGDTLGYRNDPPGIRATASNLLRGVSLHMATPVGAANQKIESVVRWLHAPLGISPDDPATTYLGLRYYIPRLSNHEDFAVSAPHLLGMLFALALLVSPRFRRQRSLAGYALLVCAWFICLSAAIKWQPWLARLQLPLFVLGSPLIAAGLLFGLQPRGASAVVVLLLLVAVLFSIFNFSRPLAAGFDAEAAKQGQLRLTNRTLLTTPRHEHYFNNRPLLMQPYFEAVESLGRHSCRDVGLIISGDEWEYPLWALSRESGRPITVRHLRLAGRLQVNHDQLPTHCAVVTVGAVTHEEHTWLTRWHRQIYTSDAVSAWIRR